MPLYLTHNAAQVTLRRMEQMSTTLETDEVLLELRYCRVELRLAEGSYTREQRDETIRSVIDVQERLERVLSALR